MKGRKRDQNKKDRYKGCREDGNERTDRKVEGCGDHDKPGKRVVTIETRIKAICWHRIYMMKGR